MKKVPHPLYDDYLYTPGANIKADWLGRAVCKSTPDSTWIFFPGQGEKKGDKEICATCPVSESCLIDAMAMPATVKGGRRAGTTLSDRSRVHGNIGQLINFYGYGDRSTRKGRTEFYLNAPEAPLLVEEAMRWWENYSFPDGERWPTEVAVTIAASVG